MDKQKARKPKNKSQNFWRTNNNYFITVKREYAGIFEK